MAWTGPGRNCSHCSFQDFHFLSKENQASLVRTFLSEPGSAESKISRLGGWGWKKDPDLWELDSVRRFPMEPFLETLQGPLVPISHCLCPLGVAILRY